MRAPNLLAATLLSTLPFASAHATPPAPERPASRLPAGVTDLPRLGDLLGKSGYVPSELALQKMAAEGQSFDPAAPVIMPPMKAIGAPFRTIGEVAVLEGDTDTLTDFGSGRYGLRYDNSRQDPVTIVRRFIAQYGDEYDFVAVWTGFWDYGADGLAYYVPILNDIAGLGDDRYDQRTFWGSSARGKLQGFLNMKSIDVYGNISNPQNYVYPVMGQEFSHRWLAQMKFKRQNGQVSAATLGRDDAHWSSLLQAFGSVQDGNTWRDNGDGTFNLTENMVRYSPLDLYGMGLFGPEEVPPFFLIENATYRGQSVTGLTTFQVGVKVNGVRTDITIDDIIAANGARRPAAVDAPKDFRMAFILVTRPGETEAEVNDQLAQIETFRNTWEGKFSEWTYQRGRMCTRVTAQCDRPQLKVSGQKVRELVGDGDGMAEPGETMSVSLTVQNTGGGVATAVRVHLPMPAGLGLTVSETPVQIGDLAAGESRVLDDAFTVTIGYDAACGTDVTLPLEVATGDYLVNSSVVAPLGYAYLFFDDFSTERGWQVNAWGEDTATSGRWERSIPVGVNAQQAGLDFQTQPAGGVTGDGRALVTGASRGDGLGGNDIDGGTTSITSPPIALDAAFDPHLAFHSWRTGLDFNTSPNRVLSDDNDVLVTEVSPDDGVTWLKVDEDISNDEVWALKTVRLRDVLPVLPATIRVRFTARDVDPQSLSEAAIDSVTVWDLQDGCFEPEPSDPSDPTDPSDPGDPTDPDPTDPIDPGTGGSQAVGGRSSDGCAGGGALGLAALAGFLAASAARRRMTGSLASLDRRR